MTDPTLPESSSARRRRRRATAAERHGDATEPADTEPADTEPAETDADDQPADADADETADAIDDAVESGEAVESEEDEAGPPPQLTMAIADPARPVPHPPADAPTRLPHDDRAGTHDRGGHDRGNHERGSHGWDAVHDRSLRDLVGAGRSQLGVDGALRGRDVNRPTDDDLAAAERDVVIVRRNWKPPV